MKKNKRLELALAYEFKDESLLERALSHRSVGPENNERLEFLGDSLLNLIIAEALFHKFPKAKEGDLTRLRANLVKGETLADVALEFNLGDYLLLGEGELKSGGFRRASILADAVEALIGAIYLESGMDVCRERVCAWFDSRLMMTSVEDVSKDSKTRLQEYLQKAKRPLPIYTVVETLGDSHCAEFIVECSVGNRYAKTKAKANSKRSAEKMAAQDMLNQLSGSKAS